MSVKQQIDYSIYLVTDREILGNRNHLKSIEEAILGGVTLVQLREKSISSLEFYNLATKVKTVTDHYNIPLIINDRLDIALSVNAAGVHLGQNDLPAKVAKKLLNPNQILGVSVTNLDEALEAEKVGADYLGVGAMFPTGTKDDAKMVTLEELNKIKTNTHIPIVAIGGIKESNVELLKNVDGLAIVSAILRKQDIKNAALNLYKLFLQR